MSQLKVRFIGGPLNGQAVWMDDARNTLTVQVATGPNTPKRTLEYRREGGILVFIEEPGPTADGH